MGIVGQATKQPEEVDIYAINYAQDMTAGDSPASAYSFVVVYRLAGAVESVASNKTVTTAAKRYLLSGGAALTLSGMSAGDRVFITNKAPATASQVASADLIDGSATLTLAALNGVALIKTANGWETEATVRVIVDASDKRVRNRMTGGTHGTTYKIETTMTSAEGRVLQDEIIVKVKEV